MILVSLLSNLNCNTITHLVTIHPHQEIPLYNSGMKCHGYEQIMLPRALSSGLDQRKYMAKPLLTKTQIVKSKRVWRVCNVTSISNQYKRGLRRKNSSCITTNCKLSSFQQEAWTNFYQEHDIDIAMYGVVQDGNPIVQETTNMAIVSLGLL